MKVLILHDDLPPGAPPDAMDGLVQARAVERALRALGHPCVTAAIPADLRGVRALVERHAPDAVFNLVESVGGDDTRCAEAALAVEASGVPMTGAPAAALAALADKRGVKRLLRSAGVPTPDWFAPPGPAAQPLRFPSRWIIKPALLHASRGIDGGAVVDAHGPGDLRARISARSAAAGDDLFAERYIDGREFALAMLEPEEGGGAPEALPPSEILFEGDDWTGPRIVGYEAKWDEGSAAYRRTPRRFDFPPRDAALLDGMRSIALECWRMFGLGGAARIDLRVDGAGRAWVIDVNANPCLSPDAGFAAALGRAGIPWERAVERMLAGALRRAGAPLPGAGAGW